MQHNQEKNQGASHGFNPEVVQKNHGAPIMIEALTPRGKKLDGFFDDLIELAVKNNKIDERTARAARLVTKTVVRTETLH